MKRLHIILLPAALLLNVSAWPQTVAASTPPAVRVVDLKAPDGTPLKASYYSAGKPGPGVLLLQQGNRSRQSWDEVATRLAATGINVLTIDLRLHGESGGTPIDQLSPEQRKNLTRSTKDDADVGFHYLAAQTGVKPDVIGIGMAGGFGVVNGVETARRHPDATKSLVLISGETNRDGLQFLHEASSVPGLFVVSDEDEYPPTAEAMELLYATSSNPGKKLVHYSASEDAPWLWYETSFSDLNKVPSTGHHGTDLFKGHPDLPGMIVDWFVTTLIQTPGQAPADGVAAASIINDLQWGGAAGLARVTQQLLEARKTDPGVQLFPEIAVDIVGEDYGRAGDFKSAIEIFKLNLLAYPDSIDAHYNLADAYLQDGQKDLARPLAEKALTALDDGKLPLSSWSNTEVRRGEIRAGLEQTLAALDADRPGAAGSVFRECPDCPEMVVIPPGHFSMGSTDEEKAWAASHGGTAGSVADEAPQHPVTLKSFALGKYDVTRAEYAAFVKATGYETAAGCYETGNPHSPLHADADWRSPGFRQTGRDPVICVDWNDAHAYVAWLNQKLTGKDAGPYRLPSESEWEYAARGGRSGKFWWGDDAAVAVGHAWFEDNAGGMTHPVGLKPANGFGLNDMAGDVWQWTEDCYAESYAGAPADGSVAEGKQDCLRSDRGGSWFYPAWLLRSATRERNPPGYRDTVMGFRVARTLPEG